MFRIECTCIRNHSPYKEQVSLLNFQTLCRPESPSYIAHTGNHCLCLYMVFLMSHLHCPFQCPHARSTKRAGL
uniref:Uncharacterized protein n=1 Tax=Physcomitrium patens TaxID=3218 RepID=A0A2K1J9Y8_PHYPA|nr:hypothetical protein PHYPA_021461 [Physcomitrium patens]